ncbi:glycerol-3-phosphate responsive antiterminator [Paenibacillus sacheonensis]|uniref:Glycerol-3-phosphate responsive antiterminator n=1 Tax=Paenibacillus sacheonensis TaxID=742054 RepID=A0A7X4YRH2_9BACL|nr:glycerol-3-phosphate responsive antiterminator [Paenibacillus sacheonensis]MBM7565000.1 glycerol uptake operon antiterminator [Paenibacillus sacheonensis]NBC70214.1 glycerol-3-phosphate responsive antiterminator [Paenibacillus sacheonensis]
MEAKGTKNAANAANHAAFLRGLAEHRTIASIKDPRHIEIALSLRSQISGIFLLTGHIGVVKGYVDVFKEHHFPVFLHLEKIGGLSTDNYGLDYLAKVIKPTGIISTKTNVIKTAKKMGLVTIQRFFLVDSEGLDNIAKSLGQSEPDVIEVMPARIPDMIGKVKAFTSLPIITGGLLYEQGHIEECLRYGAAAISTSKPELWRDAGPASEQTKDRRII